MPQYNVGRLNPVQSPSHPLRQDSTASTSSSAYSTYSTFSNPYLPSRNSTVTSAASSAYSQQRKISGHKRGISETADGQSFSGSMDNGSVENSPDHFYRNVRQTLRPLPQAPNASPSATVKRQTFRHGPSSPNDRFPQEHSEDPFVDRHTHGYPHSAGSPSSQTQVHRGLTHSHSNSFVAPDLQELQRSSTGYLRTLSKFAQDGDSEDFSLTTPAPSVVGLHNRMQLKRTDTVRNGAHSALNKHKSYGFGERNWMDKQRQFLQAYEYLCHIGEAKEWIEDIIHQPIPPIVELEEALRNGVTLAEIVQAFHPNQTFRIFRNPKLQYKHSDNIGLFFRFLEEVGLPDLFRFELIDLYEKKNIPKVIYCIHALSWLLYRKGMVDFRIGNLVGQLQFQDHELEQTQRGLDKAGVSMPSFQGMGASFGAEPEPEPEPVESEEERMERELHEQEDVITDFQNQVRGALVRVRLGDDMSELWDAEQRIVELQARLRADWSRQVYGYKLNMKRCATGLQAISRGFLVRRKQQQSAQFWQSQQKKVLQIQSLIRAKKARAEVRSIQTQFVKHTHGVRSLQSAARGALARREMASQVEHTRQAAKQVNVIQSAVRGMLLRRNVDSDRSQLETNDLQVKELQAAIRGANIREDFHAMKLALFRQQATTTRLQAAAQGFVLRHSLSQQLQAFSRAEKGIILLQGCVRAMLLRTNVGQLLGDLEESDSAVIRLQASIRGMLCRDNVGALIEELEGHEPAIIDLQAAIHGWTVRARFEEKKRFFKQNMEKVVKIQSVMRAKIQSQAYKSLTSGKNPPVGTLKGFVHLLNDSDFDFEEEIEFERLRKTVVQHIRQNELADQYIQQLDIKIALLVKNKITLDEVVKHQRHFGGHIGALLPSADVAYKDGFDLKALNKTSRRKLEHYQELFFLLQTQPQYLSRLFRRVREQATAEKECERIRHLIMGVFGYAQKRREEYYLLKLIVRSFREEIDYSTSIQEYLRTNTFCNRLFSAFVKSPRDRKFLGHLMGSLVKENVIENRDLDLESDPLQIYLSAISNEELRTGQRSHRNPDVPRDQAIRDPETRATFIAHMQDLRDITDQFFLSLEDNLSRMPFPVRFIAGQMHEAFMSRFPEEEPGYVLQLVGQWIWRNYLQPALLEPEKYGVTDRAMTQEQKKNLSEVAKVLTQAVSGRDFGADNVYLQPLNNYIRESSQRLGAIWEHATTIPSAEEHYDIDEFNDLYAKTKPTLYIKMADIFSIHKLLATESSSVCISQDDVLRDTLRELGSAQTNETELMNVSTGEILLTLTPKYLNAEDPDADIKALFTETKRCVLYIIRIQAGTSLMEILVKEVSEEDEAKWEALIRDELSANSNKRVAYAEMSNTLDFTALSYHDLKRVALENVLQLESVGRLTRANQYQDLLNAIAVDIRTKHRRRLQRQRELEGVKTTLQRLNEQAVYLEQQLKTYNDYIEQAMVTLQSKKGKKRFLLPFTKQWDHERELQRTGRTFKFGSYKYSARNLADKGVLIHWRGHTEQQWYRVDLTISSNEVGVFTIEGSSGNMMMPGASAQVPLDDLLQAQFNNTQFMEFFEGRCLRVNVNLFLHLIMKKFYNE